MPVSTKHTQQRRADAIAERVARETAAGLAGQQAILTGSPVVTPALPYRRDTIGEIWVRVALFGEIWNGQVAAEGWE